MRKITRDRRIDLPVGLLMVLRTDFFIIQGSEKNMNQSYKILEFNKIRERLAEYACTEAAKNRFLALEPFLSERELRHSLLETTESREILDAAGMPPLAGMADMEKILITAEQGGFLLPEQFEYTESCLTAVKRLKDFLGRLKYMENSLTFYDVDLDEMEDLRDEIGAAIRNGRVDDNASRLLKSLRRDIELAEAKRREKAENLLRTNKSSLSEGFVTEKNGRLCLPVKKDCRGKVNGAVVDKSSTGQTLFIEPEVIARMDEELSLLKLDEENEERRILYILSGMVSERGEIFAENKRITEKLDFIFAKGKLSSDMKAVPPEITGERKIEIRDGRHPFLAEESCVPLNFKIGGDVTGIVITGPNTGGKTVAIKTVGLLSIMAQCGLHVPCGAGIFSMQNQVLCDIGDGQDIAEKLSTFSAHITNTLSILKRAGRDSLVIMDELGSGTDPAEGMGIAVAILEELRKCGCLFLATTHYPEVKTYAEKTEHVLNARMAFDRESLKPLYRMEIGEAGESCAFYIAKRLGMPEDMLKTAAQASYGENRAGEMFLKAETPGEREPSQSLKKETAPRLERDRGKKGPAIDREKFSVGDSVLVMPEGKIAVVCRKINEKGVLQVQLKDKKIWINYKRVKLCVKAEELYPEDYDFSIIFDSVENRKARHQMERKYRPDLEVHSEE